MPVTWFIVPFERVIPWQGVRRRPLVLRYSNQIRNVDGGNWAASEVLGNVAIVKVNASQTTLDAINAEPGVVKLPKNHLDDPLSDLTQQQKVAIRNKLENMGYTLAEIQDRFGSDLGSYTLRDVLRFAARRRRKPRYDLGTDTIYVDGEVKTVRDIDEVDQAVSE